MAEAVGAEKLQADVAEFRAHFRAVEQEIGRASVGMQEVVSFTLAALFAGGHVLLEGAPGLG